jgi:hypothetical protein
MARFTSRNTTVQLVSGASSITVGPGAGDFQHGATNAENTEKVRLLDRGVFDGHVETDDLEQDWSISIKLRNQSQTHATLARILDFIHKRGSFAGLTSVNPNPDVWAFQIVVTMVQGGVTATRTLPCCVGTETFAEAADGHTISLSGTNNGAIVVT